MQAKTGLKNISKLYQQMHFHHGITDYITSFYNYHQEDFVKARNHYELK